MKRIRMDHKLFKEINTRDWYERIFSKDAAEFMLRTVDKNVRNHYRIRGYGARFI